MTSEIENWWKQSQEDIGTAEDNIKVKRYHASSFYSQQAVEKALKALYIKKFGKLVKIHNIVFLAKKLELPSELIELCDKLNPVYIETRYPDASGKIPSYEYKKEDAESDLENARKVLEWLKKMI